MLLFYSSLVALSLYEQIKGIWGYLNQPSIDKLLAYGKKIRIIEGNETTVERIRQILPEQLVEDELARVVKYPEGNWRGVRSKGGERTPFLIAPAVVGKINFSSNHCNYTIVLDNKERYNMRNPNDVKRFESLDWIPMFYVVAAPVEEQPKNLENGECVVTVSIKSF